MERAELVRATEDALGGITGVEGIFSDIKPKIKFHWRGFGYSLYKDGDFFHVEQIMDDGPGFCHSRTTNETWWMDKKIREKWLELFPPAKRWWMVLNPSLRGRKPVERHETFEEAKSECQWVADKEGTKCHVLEKVATCQPKPERQKRRIVEEVTRYDVSGNVASKIRKFSDGTSMGIGV